MRVLGRLILRLGRDAPAVPAARTRRILPFEIHRLDRIRTAWEMQPAGFDPPNSDEDSGAPSVCPNPGPPGLAYGERRRRGPQDQITGAHEGKHARAVFGSARPVHVGY